MSRIAKLPLALPSSVKVSVKVSSVDVSGAKGSITVPLPIGIKVVVEDCVLRLEKVRSLQNPAMLGTLWALLRNAVHGVSVGWRKGVELVGVGYQAKVETNKVIMTVGRSHPVVVQIPEGLGVFVNGAQLFVEGACKAKVGMLCAKLRSSRLPEPYRLTGVRYIGEVIRKKAGKSGKK